MPNKKDRLGRGFDALIPTQIVEPEFDTAVRSAVAGGGGGERVAEIEPNQIQRNPHQPRGKIDDVGLLELATSIRTHGILQPLIVTRIGQGYQLIAGERRWLAAKRLGLKAVPVLVRASEDQQKLELAMIENLQRTDLNPIETATAYRKLIDQFNLSQTEISQRIGKARVTIGNILRLLELPIEAKRALAEGKITEGHARAILSATPDQQLAFLENIIKQGWNVRQAEAFARNLKAKGGEERGKREVQSENELTRDLGKWLGTKVRIQAMAKGGRLVIDYASDQELERIYQRLKGENTPSK